MTVKVLFFGILEEVVGTNCKHYREIKSIGDLKLRLEDDFPEIAHYNFRIAHNNEIINGDSLLNDGDEIALLPPFTGG
jgi:molybdopterin converting factor small subunit